MKRSNPLHLKEMWVIVFLLGVIMINYPFIHIFNKDLLIFGFPLLFLYFMIGWPASIFVVYLFSKNMKTPTAESDEERERDAP